MFMATKDLLSDHQVYLFKKNGFVNAGPLISEADADELANEIFSIVDHREDRTRPLLDVRDVPRVGPRTDESAAANFS